MITLIHEQCNHMQTCNNMPIYTVREFEVSEFTEQQVLVGYKTLSPDQHSMSGHQISPHNQQFIATTFSILQHMRQYMSGAAYLLIYMTQFWPIIDHNLSYDCVFTPYHMQYGLEQG